MSTMNSLSGETILRNKWEIKTFSDEGKLKELFTNKLTLKEWLKELVQTENDYVEMCCLIPVIREEVKNEVNYTKNWITMQIKYVGIQPKECWEGSL